jgi:hypothetical protein
MLISFKSDIEYDTTLAIALEDSQKMRRIITDINSFAFLTKFDS